MAVFERLLKQLRSLSIADPQDKHKWNEQLTALERAWRWEKKADIQHNATQLLIQAKKYKEIELSCYIPLLKISEGETVPGYVADSLFSYPWSERSSKRKTYNALLRENKDFIKRSPHQLSDNKDKYEKIKVEMCGMNCSSVHPLYKYDYGRSSYEMSDKKSKYEKLKIEMDIMRHRFMVQLSHERKKYEKKTDYLHKRLSHQLTKLNKYILAIIEQDKTQQRLSQQLSEENKKYEQLKIETEEMLERLSEQHSHEKKHYEKLVKEKDELLNGLTEQLRHERERHEKLSKEEDKLLKSLMEKLGPEKTQYETIVKEKDELINRLSKQLSDKKNVYERLKKDKNEKLERFSQQLSDERTKYEQLKSENDEMRKSLSAQLSSKHKHCEKLEEEKKELLNRLSEQHSHEKKHYEKIVKEKEELLNSLSEQLGHEGERHEEEKNKLLKSLTEKLGQEKTQYETIEKEKDELINSLWERLCHEKKQYETIEKEKDELINSLSVELGSEREQYEKLEKEKDELLNRLSQHVSAKLMQGNPDITDLSDIYRPTKIGEMYSELYDNEWTDAYEWLTETFDEKEAIKILLDVLTTSYSYCLRHSKKQQMLIERLSIFPISTMSEIEQSKEGDFFEHMTKSVTGRQALGDIEQKLMADFQKGTKVMSVENVVEEGVNSVMDHCAKTDPSNHHFRAYIQQCLRICWLMCQQSPRMHIEVDIAKYSGCTFNKSTFKEYVKTGKTIDYVVWLPLFLHAGGNLIRKGVANGK